MITTVTAGLVSVEDGVKSSEEFGPARKVRVELSFAIPEGGTAQPVLDAVSALANSKVAELLGRAAAAPLAAAAAVSLPGSETETAAKPRTRRTAAQIAADEAAKNAPAADPSAIVDDPAAAAADVVDDDLTSSGPTAAAGADPSAIDDLTTSGPVTLISDADLNSAVQKRNAELKQPPLIRGLIGSFSPDPTKAFQLAQIPQAQRQDFLDKLAALSAPA